MAQIKPMAHTDTDVLVIGAGPAGSALAAHLAAAGVDVAVADASVFPRDKVCGDFVGPLAISELDDLGVTEEPGFQDAQRINRAGLFLNGSKLVEETMPTRSGAADHGKVIQRISLDYWVSLSAQRRGAKLLSGKRYTSYERFPGGIKAHFTKGPPISAKLLVGADGSNSTVGRQFYGRKNAAENQIIAIRAYYTGTRGPADRADLLFSENSFPGYTWFFPTGKQTANVGIGMVQKTLPEAEEHLKDILEELVQHDEALSSRLRGAKMTGKIKGWPLATFDERLPLSGDRLLLVGDAAGLINSLNGEGIQYALLSSRWAAETILDAFREEDLSARQLESYDTTLHRRLRFDMALSNMVKQCIRNRSLNPLWMEMLNVLSQRASVDRQYASTAGGVLAGIYPANAVLQPGFMGKTLLQGMVHAGITTAEMTVGGNSRQLGVPPELRNNLRLMQEQPEAYKGWIMDLMRQGTELGQNILSDTFST